MQILEATFTFSQVALFFGGLTAILTFFGIIWSYIKNIKKAAEKEIKETVDEKLETYDKHLKERLDNLADTITKAFTNEIEKLDKSFMNETSRLDKRFSDYELVDTSEKKELLKTTMLLRDGLIEAYKQDFRDIYYKLRVTGNIEDSEKAYLDKLFPKYQALGGNSDVHAKYAEICRVYEKRTQAKYDERFNENKARKRKKKDGVKEVDEETKDTPIEENKTVIDN